MQARNSVYSFWLTVRLKHFIKKEQHSQEVKMNLRLFVPLTMAATISVLAVPTLAQQAQTIRIADLQRPRSIAISGRVASIVGNNFTLNDGTGPIIVDAGPRWWHSINLSPGEQVTVTGELGKKGEFNAFRINRANG
jgi:hypothetical protein